MLYVICYTLYDVIRYTTLYDVIRCYMLYVICYMLYKFYIGYLSLSKTIFSFIKLNLNNINYYITILIYLGI